MSVDDMVSNEPSSVGQPEAYEEGYTDISPKCDRGVLKKIITEGVSDGGLPQVGCSVEVDYCGTLLDGTQFDSSYDREQKFKFTLGKGEVIKGWDIGVATMKKGEKAAILCKPEYAYGKSGSPPKIPPASTLKFEIELHNWRGEDLSDSKDFGIERFIIEPGKDFSSPLDGANVDVEIIGMHENKEFDRRTLSFPLGEGVVHNIPTGVEKGLTKFKKEETSRLILQPQYGFGNEGCPQLGIPAGATLSYTVTLKSFEKLKNTWSLSVDEKVEQAEMLKTKGTKYFQEERYGLALKLYKKVLDLLETEKDAQHQEKIDQLLLSAYLNLSLCHLKLKDYYEVKHMASEALKFDKDNEKAYFRRGQALLNMDETDDAEKDFLACLKINPNNQAAKAQLQRCYVAKREQIAKEKKLYSNMFTKFAASDAQREEIEKNKHSGVMSSVGEWGKEDRQREPSEFEKENPNILLLNGTGEFKDM